MLIIEDAKPNWFVCYLLACTFLRDIFQLGVAANGMLQQMDL